MEAWETEISKTGEKYKIGDKIIIIITLAVIEDLTTITKRKKRLEITGEIIDRLSLKRGR